MRVILCSDFPESITQHVKEALLHRSFEVVEVAAGKKVAAANLKILPVDAVVHLVEIQAGTKTVKRAVLAAGKKYFGVSRKTSTWPKILQGPGDRLDDPISPVPVTDPPETPVPTRELEMPEIPDPTTGSKTSPEAGPSGSKVHEPTEEEVLLELLEGTSSQLEEQTRRCEESTKELRRIRKYLDKVLLLVESNRISSTRALRALRAAL